MATGRRSLRMSALIVAVAALAPGSVLAGEGDAQDRGGAPEVDTQDSILTPEQAAQYALKLERAADIAAALQGSGRGGGGKGKPGSGPSPYIAEPVWDPDEAHALDTRPRQQAKWFWCGPAAAQVVINWSRGYFFSNLNGENATTNWRKQSTLAAWMGTNEQTGTWGGTLASTLNRSDAVLKPTSSWVYSYAQAGTRAEFFGKVVTDIWSYEMPIVAGTAPHLPGADDWLVSWPNVTNAHHYVVVSGYDGLDHASAKVVYDDSAGGYNGGTGKFQNSYVTMWKVIQANQGRVIW